MGTTGRKVNVIGVGMTKFQKPGASDEYNVMAANAAKAALADAKVDFKEVQSAYVGYVYGDSTCGRRPRHSAPSSPQCNHGWRWPRAREIASVAIHSGRNAITRSRTSMPRFVTT